MIRMGFIPRNELLREKATQDVVDKPPRITVLGHDVLDLIELDVQEVVIGTKLESSVKQNLKQARFVFDRHTAAKFGVKAREGGFSMNRSVKALVSTDDRYAQKRERGLGFQLNSEAHIWMLLVQVIGEQIGLCHLSSTVGIFGFLEEKERIIHVSTIDQRGESFGATRKPSGFMMG